ncbi:hypothetical protein CEXT_646742 [Caerostris extrusa]|uniref:Uncharacterized protein n=2 Tax=Caerostris extrusa TaxID=172846 RepID=A0AAV4QU40_CAEEX|nr:hypothetical protein CEXT_646742 [Caerostris extrusa]
MAVAIKGMVIFIYLTLHENASTESIRLIESSRKCSITISETSSRNSLQQFRIQRKELTSILWHLRIERQSSTFPRSIIQERHCDVNSTAGTNFRYVSSNTVQNENSDYFNSSQLIFPAAQYFENSDYTYGAENPAMTFSTVASTTTLNPFEQTCPNNSAWMQHDPNLSFYNQLPRNSRGLEDPSNYLTIYDPTNEYYNVPMNMQSGQSAMQDFEISHFQDTEYDAMAIARKSGRREENTSLASDLNCTSINAKYHRNPHIENEYNHTPAMQHASTRTNTPRFLDRQLDMNEIPHCSYKSQGQFFDKMKFQNVFQCHFCGSYQRNLKGQELPVNSSNVPFKCNECNEMLKSKEKIQTCSKIAEYCENSSALKVPKKRKPLHKRFPCTGFKNPDYIFGKNPQEIPATISHSAEGADFNSSAFMNRTSTFQSSTFPQSTTQERHWDVNSTATTDVRYALSNAVQNKNFDYFKSSRGSLIPAAQYFENSACTSGVENLPNAVL